MTREGQSVGKMIRPEQFITEEAPCGSMMYEFADIGGVEQVVYLIREDALTVASWRTDPLVGSRGGIIMVAGVAVIPLLVTVRGPSIAYYECWLNVHASPEGFRYLDSLVSQERVMLIFYDKQRIRSISMANALFGLDTKAVAGVRARKAWSMEDFDRAKAEVCAAYPTLEGLWGALGGE